MKRCIFHILLCALLLTGCGAQALPPEGTPESIAAPPATVLPAASELPYEAGETVDYRWDDAVSIRMTLPALWAWEEAPRDDSNPPTSVGIVVYPEGRSADCALHFACWPAGFGMCGTGVTFAEVSSATGEAATLATEAMDGKTMVHIILQNRPGDYVAWGLLPDDVWNGQGDTILSMVLNAEVGGDCMTLDRARALAEDAWPETDASPENLTVSGRYDVMTRVWTLTRGEITTQGGQPCTTPLDTVTVAGDGTLGDVTPVQWNGGK